MLTNQAAEQLMRRAIEECYAGLDSGQTPFGAVIANRSGDIVCAAHNSVFRDSDPTAHAEVTAIRQCCNLVKGIDLSGGVIVSTCEPCPMCAAAIHWARLSRLIYGASIKDAKDAGFNELSVSCENLYRLGGSRVEVWSGALREECKELFQDWMKRSPRVY
jgi:tRNA(Arg) A34 adenosine deaminase TadA